jgi:hypothetical protein
MADLGDIGRLVVKDDPMWAYRGYFTTTKQPTSVDAHITDAPDGAAIMLTTRTGRADVGRADATGVHFYDLDNGDYLAYVMFDGSPGLAWSINVTGTVVTITRISTSGIVTVWTL